MHYVIAIIIIIIVIIIIIAIIILSLPWKLSCTGTTIAVPWFVSSSAHFVSTVLTWTANVTILLSASSNDEYNLISDSMAAFSLTSTGSRGPHLPYSRCLW